MNIIKLGIYGVLMVLFMSSICAADIINVGKEYTCKDIRHAVSVAKPGDTIIVRAGTYVLATPVVIRESNITLVSDGMNNVTIWAPYKTKLASNESPAMFLVMGNNVKISGFKFVGAATNVTESVEYAGRDGYNCAIYVKNASNIDIRNNDFTRLYGDAVRVYNSTGIKCENNRLYTHGHDGFSFIKSCGIIIKNNYIETIVNSGIRLDSSSDCTITQNTFKNGYLNSGWTSIQLQGNTSLVSVTRNLFTSTADSHVLAGLMFTGKDITMCDNVGCMIQLPWIYDVPGAVEFNNFVYENENEWGNGYGYSQLRA